MPGRSVQQQSVAVFNKPWKQKFKKNNFKVLFAQTLLLKLHYSDVIILSNWYYCFKQEFVRPRWPYDMRPSVRAEKYIRDAGP